MLLLAGSFNGLQVGVFIFVCFVLAGTIWLYRTSMRSIKQLQEDQRKQYSHLIAAVDAEWERSSWTNQLASSLRRFIPKASDKAAATAEPIHPAASLNSVDLLAVKNMLEQQQQLTQKLITQIDQQRSPQPSVPPQAVQQAKLRVDDLELLLEDKEEEIQQLLLQQKVSDKLASKLELLQQEFFGMQESMRKLELQAAQASKLAMDLEESKASYAQLTVELSRKSEKVQQVFLENTKLHEQLAETEDKLQEANFQRHQLFKKVQMLEVTNNELQTLTDTNSKLQTELRRISELESMLNTIMEERNQLLRK
ncbi:hypothetical protein [Flavisolibacter tropicus]|uniref:Uncharacterized protein n=1 Tax=Flavisolibacter tropicus TaxID=1492898 RepID=A0A172TW58_9BACT|nr:hypothetical protein [Flavisolibacter tropicus]ANE51341.1 hypothetical protein SY85_13290 [Flavisolibacter tropicus]